MKKLYFLFKDEITKAKEDELLKKANQENIIKMRKKKEEKKLKKKMDKIELTNFNFHEIKNVQDKAIYHELKEKIEDKYDDIYYQDKKNLLIKPSEKKIRDGFKIRIREKKYVPPGNDMLEQELPSTIKKTLTKIKEQNLQEEENKKKTILPPINSRPKSQYLPKKNTNKELIKDKK